MIIPHIVLSVSGKLSKIRLDRYLHTLILSHCIAMQFQFFILYIILYSLFFTFNLYSLVVQVSSHIYINTLILKFLYCICLAFSTVQNHYYFAIYSDIKEPSIYSLEIQNSSLLLYVVLFIQVQIIDTTYIFKYVLFSSGEYVVSFEGSPFKFTNFTIFICSISLFPILIFLIISGKKSLVRLQLLLLYPSSRYSN